MFRYAELTFNQFLKGMKFVKKDPKCATWIDINKPNKWELLSLLIDTPVGSAEEKRILSNLTAAERYNPTLLTHYFSATFRPFCAVFSPFFRGFRLPGAKTERTGEKWRKMGEIWGRNGREIAVAK